MTGPSEKHLSLIIIRMPQDEGETVGLTQGGLLVVCTGLTSWIVEGVDVIGIGHQVAWCTFSTWADRLWGFGEFY